MVNPAPSMSKNNVGVKSPEAGVPDSVDGITTRGGTVGMGDGLMEADGVADLAGITLSPAASTVKVLVTIFMTPFMIAD